MSDLSAVKKSLLQKAKGPIFIVILPFFYFIALELLAQEASSLSSQLEETLKERVKVCKTFKLYNLK